MLGEGTHQLLYEKLGAHPLTLEGVSGTAFAVWAPNAQRVSVVGDFNEWDGRRHPMQSSDSGVWEVFLPEVGVGELYKFEIKSNTGAFFHKADPFAFAAETRPSTASKVADFSGFSWTDAEWLGRRRTRDPLTQPISVYEVHLGSWKRVPEEQERFLNYR